MSQPWLKNKEVAAMALPVPEKIERKADGESEGEFDSLEGAMSELHSALNSKDYKSAAQIFRSAFDLLDAAPHEEGPHI